jgi:cell wall-associated NlpC family hydrolase
MPPFDPRVTAARDDFAAKELEGRVTARRYVEGRVYEIAEPQAPVWVEPRPDASLVTEALRGERVVIYDRNAEGFAWGQLAADNYVGWLPEHALGPPGPSATHKVSALRTLAFPAPSIKLPPIEALPFGARVVISGFDGRMAITSTNLYVPVPHLKLVDENEVDFAAVAERFLGAPYLWGGKTVLGLDCSGLVQVALTACGAACPRDSDMQEAALGEPVRADAYSDLRRGDLMFWKGHVAIVRDRATLLHANAFHMAVAIEPIADAIKRIGESGSDVTMVKRLMRQRPE